MSDEEKNNFIKMAETGKEWEEYEDVRKKLGDELPSDDEISKLEDKNDVYQENVTKKYDKFVSDLANGKYPRSVDSVKHKKKSQNKKEETNFKTLRQKVAGDVYKEELRRTDIAAKRLGKKGRVFSGVNFQENLEKCPLNTKELFTLRHFVNGDFHLTGIQYDEFCKFSTAWKVFKFVVREKWTNLLTNIYEYLIKKLPRKKYYGYNNLEDMMEATGGKPYDTLLTNKNINPDVMYLSADEQGKVVDLKPQYEIWLKKRHSNLTGYNKRTDLEQIQEELQKNA